MCSLPYGKQEYWENRYLKDMVQFDWYQRLVDIQELIFQFIRQDHKILNIGAGNSRFTEEMIEEGFYDQTCIDFSQTVVNQMNQKLRDKGINIQYVRDLKFKDGEFSVVFDKGTLDCIFCAESSTIEVNKALGQIYRVLNHNGIYICVSNGEKQNRLNHLQKFNWKIDMHSINRPIMNKVIIQQDKDIPKQHTIYICQKNE